jgi:hypothetical protein
MKTIDKIIEAMPKEREFRTMAELERKIQMLGALAYER